MTFNRILFPIDFSEHSQKLNAEVEWLAARFNSTVTLMHVFEIPSSWYGAADAPMLTGDDIVAFANADKQRLQNYSIHIPGIAHRTRFLGRRGGLAYRQLDEGTLDRSRGHGHAWLWSVTAHAAWFCRHESAA